MRLVATALLLAIATATLATRLAAQDGSGRPRGPRGRAAAQADWVSIFDGRTLTGWRGWRQPSGARGWVVKDGAMTREGPGGDLLFDRELGDFELELEWKVGPGANSGIMFHASETTAMPWEGGPEMQILDDAGHPDGRNRLTSAGANYAVEAIPAGLAKGANQWNRIRLVVRGMHVEHWMNGTKALEYELGSPDWKRRVAASKWKDVPTYGTFGRGYVVLQGDHSTDIWFRNVRLKDLDAARKAPK